MPTQAYFDRYPSFPGDVPTIELPCLSFAKLLAKEQSESDVLFKVCRAVGFFLLDFQGCSEGEAFLKKAENMFNLNEEVNALDVDELMKYTYKPPHSLFGYAKFLFCDIFATNTLLNPLGFVEKFLLLLTSQKFHAALLTTSGTNILAILKLKMEDQTASSFTTSVKTT